MTFEYPNENYIGTVVRTIPFVKNTVESARREKFHDLLFILFFG